MAAAAAGGRTYSFKAVLLGEGCVGKTSLVLRYCENKFNDKHITTLQVRAPRSPARPSWLRAGPASSSGFVGETFAPGGSCLPGCHCWVDA